MRFLADECVWRLVVEALRNAGLEGDWVHDLSPGFTDREVLALSFSGKCLLVTEDRDFGELIFRERVNAYAVVRARLSAFEGDKKDIAADVAERIIGLGDGLIGQVTTIEPNRTRQRILPASKRGKD